MGEAHAPALFTIAHGRPFADALADGVLARHGKEALGLARGLILVPTNRAVLAVRDAFVRRAEPGLLLPRLVAIGDLDLDESIGAALETLDPAIPPAIDPLTRQAMLARIIQVDARCDAGVAMRLARDLGRVLDQLLIARVHPKALEDVAPEHLADHWQISLRKLATILDTWPQMLAERGCIDLAERRNRLLDGLAARWQREPPPGYVIAAGIDSAAPAIVGLLRTISRMPGGAVVFAGLDCEMPEDEWNAIGGSATMRAVEVHPQHHLRALLDAMGAGRAEVRQWRGGKAGLPKRAQLARLAFLPPDFTGQWERRQDGRALSKGISAMALETPAEEAQAIAIALRHAVETPGRTAALVTPDRGLAARVSALLARWGIAADDSAGRALALTATGSLMLALAEAAAQRFAPVPLMALLKHPLVFGADRDLRLQWLDGVRSLDKALRGPRPAPGLAGVAAHLDAAKHEDVRKWWMQATDLLSPLEAPCKTLADWVARLIETATALCGDGIWAGIEGRCLSDQMAALQSGLSDFPLSGGREALPGLLRDRLDAASVRPPAGGHPRIFIWGLIEARLQRADLLILGGLNEGVWPALPAPDPWLAPPIRRALGLPGLERRIGLSAHDLASALGAPEVILTRAKHDARAPLVASRFWLRLETLTKGFDPPEPRYDLLARALDRPIGPPQRQRRPAPAPPVEDRPRRISVTQVDGLNADPYAFYAKAMLGLDRLEALDANADARWTGTILHRILDDWFREDDCAAGKLLLRMARALDGPEFNPLVRALTQTKLDQGAKWIEAEVARLRAEGRMPVRSEIRGAIEHAGIMLSGQADRIDRMADGSLAIVDYKQGDPPKAAQVAKGLALQLGLIGLIAERGGFEGLDGKATAFEYWSFARGNGRSFGKLVTPFSGNGENKLDPETFVARMTAFFEKAAAKWLTGNEPFKAKRRPEYAFGDYDHLMRLEEWEGRE